MASVIGIIGGSGLYELDNFKITDEIEIETPFGKPSDKVIVGTLGEKKLAFLPRHGKGHRLLPSEINYRANIYALKEIGVDRIISVSAVGSMKEEIVPGKHFVIPDQFIDLTKKRESTFFGNGIVAHVSFAEPVCPELTDIVYRSGKKLGFEMVKGGIYINMEGPQFSTKGESLLYRSWGASVIGMTNATEAKLAREAEICYVSINIPTDYDCWKDDEDSVSVEAVVKRLLDSLEKVKIMLKEIIVSLPEERVSCSCASALQDAIITDINVVPEGTLKNLKVILKKYVEV